MYSSKMRNDNIKKKKSNNEMMDKPILIPISADDVTLDQTTISSQQSIFKFVPLMIIVILALTFGCIHYFDDSIELFDIIYNSRRLSSTEQPPQQQPPQQIDDIIKLIYINLAMHINLNEKERNVFKELVLNDKQHFDKFGVKTTTSSDLDKWLLTMNRVSKDFWRKPIQEITNKAYEKLTEIGISINKPAPKVRKFEAVPSVQKNFTISNKKHATHSSAKEIKKKLATEIIPNLKNKYPSHDGLADFYSLIFEEQTHIDSLMEIVHLKEDFVNTQLQNIVSDSWNLAKDVVDKNHPQAERIFNKAMTQRIRRNKIYQKLFEATKQVTRTIFLYKEFNQVIQKRYGPITLQEKYGIPAKNHKYIISDKDEIFLLQYGVSEKKEGPKSSNMGVKYFYDDGLGLKRMFTKAQKAANEAVNTDTNMVFEHFMGFSEMGSYQTCSGQTEFETNKPCWDHKMMYREFDKEYSDALKFFNHQEMMAAEDDKLVKDIRDFIHGYKHSATYLELFKSPVYQDLGLSADDDIYRINEIITDIEDNDKQKGFIKSTVMESNTTPDNELFHEQPISGNFIQLFSIIDMLLDIGRLHEFEGLPVGRNLGKNLEYVNEHDHESLKLGQQKKQNLGDLSMTEFVAHPSFPVIWEVFWAMFPCSGGLAFYIHWHSGGIIPKSAALASAVSICEPIGHSFPFIAGFAANLAINDWSFKAAYKNTQENINAMHGAHRDPNNFILEPHFFNDLTEINLRREYFNGPNIMAAIKASKHGGVGTHIMWEDIKKNDGTPMHYTYTSGRTDSWQNMARDLDNKIDSDPGWAEFPRTAMKAMTGGMAGMVKSIGDWMDTTAYSLIDVDDSRSNGYFVAVSGKNENNPKDTQSYVPMPLPYDKVLSHIILWDITWNLNYLPHQLPHKDYNQFQLPPLKLIKTQKVVSQGKHKHIKRMQFKYNRTN